MLKKVNIDELLENKFIPVIDPTAPESPASTGANAFLAEYGGILEEVAIICKKEDGYVTYRSGAAPSDPIYEKFFTDFTELANDLGIRTHAIAYAFGDSFLGQDSNYSIVRSDGSHVHDYVDPSMEGYWKHMNHIAREIARHPIETLNFQEFLFPRQEYSFSRRSIRKFSEISGVSLDTTYIDIQRAPHVMQMFEEWRGELITTAFREAVETAKTEQPGLDVGMIVPVDPETEWNTGYLRHFGISLDKIIEISGYVIYHIMPYSPMYPEPDTPGWDQLLRAIRSSTLYEQTGYKKALFVWGLDAEDDAAWLKRLQGETRAENVFTRLEHPPKYAVKREIHRGV